MKKTQKWLYRTIFTGVALAIFSVLLYYAATTSSAPKFFNAFINIYKCCNNIGCSNGII